MNRREFLKKSLEGIIVGIPLIYNCGKNPVESELDDIYKYPVPDYDSEEWKQRTPEDVKAFYQIPEDVLNKLSTKVLIQAYLDYPLLGVIGAYNSFQDGFNIVRKQFNGIDELYIREDIEIELINFYQNMDPSSYDVNWEPFKIGEFVQRMVYIELLLAQEDFLSKLEEKNVKLFISDALKKLEIKREIDIYRTYPIVNSAFLLARVINSKGEENGFKTELLQIEGIEGFLKYGTVLEEKTLLAIINLAYKFIIS